MDWMHVLETFVGSAFAFGFGVLLLLIQAWRQHRFQERMQREQQAFQERMQKEQHAFQARQKFLDDFAAKHPDLPIDRFNSLSAKSVHPK